MAILDLVAREGVVEYYSRPSEARFCRVIRYLRLPLLVNDHAVGTLARWPPSAHKTARSGNLSSYRTYVHTVKVIKGENAELLVHLLLS